MKRVGVLGLQGGVIEHLKMLEQLEGVEGINVRDVEQLQLVDGLILPGGESTTLGHLLRSFDLLEPLKQKIKQGLPVWGTCAGMILLAEQIEGEAGGHLQTMAIEVRRNGYGRQLGSFETKAVIPEVSEEAIPLVFIRAPYVKEVGDEVKVLLKLENQIVACQQKNMLATSFHPELTNDVRMHRYFVETFI